MSDREPVDIMGVVAFPNPNKDERVIRFIDSEYHTLFTIKDGESIVITRFDGEKMVFPCKYIDDCHVCIGNSAYHICEFAEMQERNGNIYVPSAPKISDEICTYEIYQIPATADVDYYFRSYAAAKGKLRSADYQRSYVYMLRCTPVKGDYQFYIYCYQRKPFEKAQKEQQKNDRLAVKKRAEPER